MMQDISMHLLELIRNSIEANATNVIVQILSSNKQNKIILTVEDNGIGMDEISLNESIDPFKTSRKTRHIGMGLPFMKQLSEQCNGSLELFSEKGKGTKIVAMMQKNHIDLPPMGNIGELMMICIQSNPNVEFELNYETDQGKFVFNTKQIKKEIEGINLQDSEVLLWIRDYITQEVSTVEEDYE